MRHARQIAIILLSGVVVFVAGVLSRPILGQLKAHLPRMQTSDPNTVFDSEYYERKSGLYAELRANRSIVFLGDSRIERAEWSELFARSDISNRGISGDTTGGILKRLATSMPNDATLCVMQAGVNDLELGVPIETVLANQEEILRYVIEQRHCRALLTSILLVDRDRAALNARISECNRRLAQLVETLGAGWLDLNRSLAPEGYLASEYTNDGVHLTGKGYLRMRDALAPLMPPSSAELQ